MNSRVSPAQGASVPCCPPARAADSSARTTVVPTATTRPPRARAARNGRAGRRPDRGALGVQRVRREILAAHRLEGARPDVQRHERALHAARLERRDQRRVEVQARRRRRHRARLAREDALVALAIGGAGRRGGCRAAAAPRPTCSKNSSAGCGSRDAPQLALAPHAPAPPRRRCSTSSPSRIGLLADSCASASWPPSARSSRISTRPPEGLCPKTRAATTRVSLSTSRSPGAR